MNAKTLILVSFLGTSTLGAYAHFGISFLKNKTDFSLVAEDGKKLPLEKREKEDHEGNNGPDIIRSIVLTPEVTMQGNTLHFVTACEGYEFRLVQGDTVCYSEEITGDTLTIPANLRGTYELQIVSENYIFFTEVTL